MQYIKYFEEITLKDLEQVGGKNASLGQMMQYLVPQGLRIPPGFAVNVKGYWHFIDHNHLRDSISNFLRSISSFQDIQIIQEVSAKIKSIILQGQIPTDLEKEIVAAYRQLAMRSAQQTIDVAVRSSATAEDLPNASFAGQQETFLHINNEAALLESYKKCLASLFTPRAIVYRMQHNFNHMKIGLSVGVQKMIRADLNCSGVAFSLDTETGFKDVVLIEGSWGLGEAIVQGIVTPDSFTVYKPKLKEGFIPIIKKQLGQKAVKMVYAEGKDKTIKKVEVEKKDQQRFILSDTQIIELARAVAHIEEYYSALKKVWTPMDIEWAVDGIDNQLYILQARPETVFAQKSKKDHTIFKQYRLSNIVKSVHTITTGLSIGRQIVSGIARVVKGIEDIQKIQKGDIIITPMTDPDWVPALKKAAGIVTNQGGRTCHAAIVSRELGITAIVGAQQATELIQEGEPITLDCSRGVVGYVLQGQLPHIVDEISLETIPQLSVDILLNIANPDVAFHVSFLPTQGVGLTRIEFIIANNIKVHPMALLFPEKITDPHVIKVMNNITGMYTDYKQFFIETLSQGIGTIAAAFYPRPVIVRFSDFKSNEYRELVGGSYFEPLEENPMMGLRGASRYYHDSYRPAFALECAAIKNVRETMGLTNIKLMIPFVRTVQEAHYVMQELRLNGIDPATPNLEIIMMCELPSNVILLDQFAQLFSGFSIGSNDLAQFTLGVDRDSKDLNLLFDERDVAVKKMMSVAIEAAKRLGKPIGICGQAPSDFPEIGDFLIERGISSLSLNADSVLPFLLRYKDKKAA